jgi:ABC-type uncharacterized transport system substrate-binding protein
LAGRVIRGENPQTIPLGEVAVEELSISRASAEQLGITIPAELSEHVRP